MTETEAPAYNAVRFVADYQLMSDEPPRIWADIVFGDAQQRGVIHSYEVLTTLEGPFELTYLVVSVVVLFDEKYVRAEMDHSEATVACQELLDAIVGDDISCRFVEGVKVADAVATDLIETAKQQVT